MGADYSFYVKFIATKAPTFFGYIISVLASVLGDLHCEIGVDLIHSASISGWKYNKELKLRHLLEYMCTKLSNKETFTIVSRSLAVRK